MKESAFVEAIVAEPEDDAHRLVFADWLDEQGQADRASFIRAQVELAHLEEADPRYPEVLARSRRTEMLTRPRRRPMVDHIPNGRVLFRRGFIAGVEISPEAFLRQAPEQWARVPLESLCLAGNVSGDAEECAELALRKELGQVRMLGFRGNWDRSDCAPLLTDGRHLANVRDLRLPGDLTQELLLDNLAFLALESLAVDVAMAEDWERFVPRHGPNLRRIAMTGEAVNDGSWAWPAPTLDWLLRSRHGSTLEEAYLRRGVWQSQSGFTYMAAAPLRDPSLLGRLRRVEMDGESAARLVYNPDWGNLEHLAIRGDVGEEVLDEILSSAQAQRLSSLLIEARDPEFEYFTLPRLRRCDRAAWQTLRITDWFPDLLAACRGQLLRLSVDDLAVDLTFAKAGLTFPELRFLLLALDEPPRNLPKLIASLGAPNLCTLVLLGIPLMSSSTLRRLAQLEGMPHFSLVGAGEFDVDNWWVLHEGQAERVSPSVLPMDTDWWDPLPDRPR